MDDGPPARLDKAFADWMRSRLGYQRTARRIVVFGSTPTLTYRVSVHGRAYSSRWRFADRVAVGAFCITVVIVNMPWHSPTSSGSILAANAAGVVALASFVAAYFGKRLTQRHAWVQCKDFSRPLRRRDVKKLHNAVQDVRASAAAPWIASDVILVSGTAGFEPAALALAEAHAIVCYRRAKSGFERAS